MYLEKVGENVYKYVLRMVNKKEIAECSSREKMNVKGGIWLIGKRESNF